MPPWSIVHSRVYKAQLPYFSERFRCITFDARGNGKSDRPADAAAYTLDNYVADALAVMDATDAGKAILVGLSFGGMLACVLAAHHPERVKAAILAGTVATIGPANSLHLGATHFLAKRERFEGWDKFNRDYWLADYPDFAEHFIRNIFSEPHSTRQIEDGIELGQRDHRAGAGQDGRSARGAAAVRCRRGDVSQDPLPGAVHPWRRRPDPALCARAGRGAEVTGAEFVTIAGGGHNPLGRFPAKSNALIIDFLDRRLGIAAPAKQAEPRAATREKRALYLSSPIGLGHGRRDIAITRELRKLHPDLQVDWLAQDPVTRLLEANGERVHPLSARLASESRHIELESGEHELHCFQAHPPHGRGADQELHDLPGCGRSGRL